MKKKTTSSLILTLVLFASGMGAGASQEPIREYLPEEIIVPEGTVIPIIITAYLNTRSTQVGDTVYAETAYPIWAQQRLVIPKGSSVRGTITEVERPGKISGKGSLAVRFDDILLPNGARRALYASLQGIHSQGKENIDRKSESVSSEGGYDSSDIRTVISTTAQGAVIGSIVNRRLSGAITGGSIGAAGGIVGTLLTRDRHLVINPGTLFDLELKRPLKFAYNEIDFTTSQLNNSRQTLPSPTRNNSRDTQQRPWIGRIPGIGIPIPF